MMCHKPKKRPATNIVSRTNRKINRFIDSPLPVYDGWRVHEAGICAMPGFRD
jgi:hypothetical protein